MKKTIADFCKYFVAIAAVVAGADALAAQAPNPRASGASSSNVVATSSSASGTAARATRRVVRGNPAGASLNKSGRTGSTVSRSATSRPTVTVSRSAVMQPVRTNTTTTARSGTIRQTVATGANGAARSGSVSRAASSNVVRATHNPASNARAATTNTVVGASRAQPRATAVFTDISAIGGGYAECRTAYATCMDQFCANANDTYRRCICSARYDEFRNTENAIDQALTLLAQFQDNNLNAVGLSAAEVAAMYSATEGENAIKKDTSAAGQMLAEINDLLSGRSSSSGVENANAAASAGVLSIDFTSDMDDIWGDSGSSIFDTDTGVDLAALTGQELYAEAARQCLEVVGDSCENDAVLTMARSAYGIMVTQDCNLYERNINAQKENLEQTVRTAEKYLREARLEEYQSHNSADVNECITNVRNAILTDVACGPNYEKCMDPTGAYINSTTGEPIYSPRLFQLENLIGLSGTVGDVLADNQDFDDFLDEKRIYAQTALDSCRDIADTVWTEFKRQALIEIAQAQDEKLEEVKMSCVSTVAECYDTQSGALRDFDTTTAQYSGAISAAAARQMCQDKVIACASLYGNNEKCTFDANGHIQAEGANTTTYGGINSGATGMASERCGLTALLAFVDTVDTQRINEGCETAIENYLTELCTPASGDMGYPWGCIGLSADEVFDQVSAFAQRSCRLGDADLTTDITSMVTDYVENIQFGVMDMLAEECEQLGGYWIYNGDLTYGELGSDATPYTDFYSQVFGVRLTNFAEAASTENRGNNQTSPTYGDGAYSYTALSGANQSARYGMSYGQCAENTIQVRCLAYNEMYGDDVASYDAQHNVCNLSDEWYRQQCESMLGGYYENGACYVLSADTILHSVNGMSRKDFENQ